MSFDSTLLDHYPLSPGVYLMKNHRGDVLYVGKAKCLRKRLRQYFLAKGDDRPTLPLLLQELDSIDTIIVTTEKEALLLENTLIKQHKPKYNILLKDDKTYISLSIHPKKPWPRLQLLRFKQKPQDGALYFGPYTSTAAARQTYDLMAKLFPLRQCSDEEFKRRTRPCLLHSIKRCLAPCVDLCTKDEYDLYVEGAIDFLRGNNASIIKHFQQEMELAEEKLEFEKAAALHRTLQQIQHVTKQPDLLSYSERKDTDALGIYREGESVSLSKMLFRNGQLVGSEGFYFPSALEEDEDLFTSFFLQQYTEKETLLPKEILLPLCLPHEKELSSILQETHGASCKLLHPQKGDKKRLLDLANANAKSSLLQKKQPSKEDLLLQLQEKLHLSRYPKRIECFDTSNLAASHLVASMAVFIDGKEDKQKMRLYHIHDIHKPDDYAALHQVLTRRLQKAKEEEDFPDLLLIDGGKGQLSIALQVLKELDIVHIDLLSLVKEEGRHDRGLTLERICSPLYPDPLQLPSTSPLLFFLQTMRDAAHRKALSFHRRTRSKHSIKSKLDEVPGIGPIKKKRLLEAFGSLSNALLQSDDTLQTKARLSWKDIQSLRSFLSHDPKERI